MIQIIHTNDVWIEIEGEKKPVTSKFFVDNMWQGEKLNPFLSFQKFLKEKEDNGYTKYYMHSMWTQHEKGSEGEPVTLLWVRGRFVK